MKCEPGLIRGINPQCLSRPPPRATGSVKRGGSNAFSTHFCRDNLFSVSNSPLNWFDSVWLATLTWIFALNQSVMKHFRVALRGDYCEVPKLNHCILFHLQIPWTKLKTHPISLVRVLSASRAKSSCSCLLFSSPAWLSWGSKFLYHSWHLAEQGHRCHVNEELSWS